MQTPDGQEMWSPTVLAMGSAIRVGRIVDIDTRGQAFVVIDGMDNDPVRAQTILTLPNSDDASAVTMPPVLLACPDNHDGLPIIVGFIRNELVNNSQPECSSSAEQDSAQELERSVMTGRDRVEIRCGKSSIEMNRDGKISIKGTQILSRATQKNRIKGGAVAIN